MRILFSALLLLLLPAAHAHTEDQVQAQAAVAEPDAFIVSQLQELEYDYEMDGGDFRLLFDLEDERSQLVWIRNRTYESHDVAMRDVWSIAFELTGKYASIKLADRLLRHSWDGVMGSWVRDGDYIVYMVKLPADASAALLDAAIGEVIDKADALERERGGEDVY
jgi:hypothetical protein